MEDPLEKLVKSSEEIARMRASGEIPPKPIFKKRVFLQKTWKEKGLKSGIAIELPDCTVLRNRFETFNDAGEWAEWNYKGHNESWRIIKIPE
jgi:hypothetical protein